MKELIDEIKYLDEFKELTVEELSGYRDAIRDVLKLIESHQQELDAISPELKEFVLEMESELKRHDREKGDSWKSMPMSELVDIFYTSMCKLKYVDVVDGKECNQLIDIANLAMMVWYRSITEVTKCQ